MLHANFPFLLNGEFRRTIVLQIWNVNFILTATVNSLTPVAHLEGIVPCAEDWHAQLNLLDVWFWVMSCYTYIHTYMISFILSRKGWKYYYSGTSSGDRGTMYQLHNLIDGSISPPKQ